MLVLQVDSRDVCYIFVTRLLVRVLCNICRVSRKSENRNNPRGAYLFQAHLRGCLIETGGLFNLETTMVSVLHKELEYKVEKLKYKKF